jgi:uncharacterized membrane protein YeiH
MPQAGIPISDAGLVTASVALSKRLEIRPATLASRAAASCAAASPGFTERSSSSSLRKAAMPATLVSPRRARCRWWGSEGPIFRVLDLASVVVFAITRALVASRKQMDTVGFMWMGVITFVGGGTLRDLLLDAPVFWTVDLTPLALCLGAVGLVLFSARLVASRDSFLLCVDAFGMALLSTVGTAKVLDLGTSALVVSAWEVATAAAGGILRDILGQEPSILLRRDI